MRVAEGALNVSAVAFFALTFSCVLWLTRYDDAPPFTSTHVALTDSNDVAQSVFRPGDSMYVRRDLCFMRDTTVQFNRRFVSVGRTPEIIVNINTTSGLFKKGCVPNANVVRVPPETPPGRYAFDVVIQYSNNPLQRGAATLLPAPILTIVAP